MGILVETEPEFDLDRSRVQLLTIWNGGMIFYWIIVGTHCRSISENLLTKWSRKIGEFMKHASALTTRPRAFAIQSIFSSGPGNRGVSLRIYLFVKVYFYRDDVIRITRETNCYCLFRETLILFFNLQSANVSSFIVFWSSGIFANERNSAKNYAYCSDTQLSMHVCILRKFWVNRSELISSTVLHSDLYSQESSFCHYGGNSKCITHIDIWSESRVTYNALPHYHLSCVSAGDAAYYARIASILIARCVVSTRQWWGDVFAICALTSPRSHMSREGYSLCSAVVFKYDSARQWNTRKLTRELSSEDLSGSEA